MNIYSENIVGNCTIENGKIALFDYFINENCLI